MASTKGHPIPKCDPISGKPLHISELACDESGIVIRGRFQISRFSQLDPEQERFLETFLRCRGNISTVEKELGISYPTVRSRLDVLLQTLGFAPVKEEEVVKKATPAETRKEVLGLLERGEITAEEAKERMRGGMRK
jgi:hypothetical protein